MKTVLVVDDERAILNVVSEILQDEGYDVLKARDGLEAWECALRAKPDLVLSNVMLPKLDGHGLARAIRSDPALKATPVVLMSAASEPGPTGFFTAFVRKPFSLEDLLAVVVEHIGDPEP